MFGSWDELCLNFEDCGRKEVGNHKLFNGCALRITQCSLNNFIFKLEPNKFGVPKSKLQGVFLFSFLNACSFIFFVFPISKFHHALFYDYEELQV
jgi:hypothetical protein